MENSPLLNEEYQKNNITTSYYVNTTDRLCTNITSNIYLLSDSISVTLKT